MDEISLEEMLWHYVSRVSMAIENIEKQSKDLENLMTLLDESMKNPIANAIQKKLMECKEESDDIKTCYEDAMYLLRKQINELEDMMDGYYSV